MNAYGAAAPIQPSGQGSRSVMVTGSLSIGEVLAHLRADFPEVTISKLRFLEAEGLVEPSRTPAGYRKYGPADVARLRFVLAAQRDHYLPLRVIREQLAIQDPGLDPPPVRAALIGDATQVAEAMSRAPARLTRAELLNHSGLTDEELTEAEQHGLIRVERGGYDEDALRIAVTLHELAGYGLSARHLRGYKATADREAGQFAALVAPLARQNTPAARDRAAETVSELAALTQQLRATLLRVGLRDTLGA